MDAEVPPRRQRVVGLIGCPGAGKTTYARRYDPLQGWVHLTLDDLRQTFWPPDRHVYWQVRRTDWDEEARRLLHGVKVAALDAALAAGFSVVMADTHLTQEVFVAELQVIERHGLSVEWKVFDLLGDAPGPQRGARSDRPVTSSAGDHSEVGLRRLPGTRRLVAVASPGSRRIY